MSQPIDLAEVFAQTINPPTAAEAGAAALGRIAELEALLDSLLGGANPLVLIGRVGPGEGIPSIGVLQGEIVKTRQVHPDVFDALERYLASRGD